jgi:hypothetical protein
MKRICIIHFNPIERYPPAINFLRYISENKVDAHVTVITTGPDAIIKAVSVPGIIIKRVVRFNKKDGRLSRAWLYFLYHIKSLNILKKFRPDSILYYETLSAGAPALYKRFIDRHVDIFVHYHEYTSLNEYKNGMILTKWLRQLELRIYKEAKWVSHTNEDRMNMFLRDVSSSPPRHTHIFPNFPPADWFMKAASTVRNDDERIGFVYVGSLSLETMHTREIARMVALKEDKYYWHIYSDNLDKNVLDFLSELGAKNIAFKGAVEYAALPNVLAGYDIGLILYTGFIDNHVFSTPNKLYEYHVCGLNVLYPAAIKSIRLFKSESEKPWVREIDFTNPILPDGKDAYRVEKISKTTFAAESIYELLANSLLRDSHKSHPSEVFSGQVP